MMKSESKKSAAKSNASTSTPPDTNTITTSFSAAATLLSLADPENNTGPEARVAPGGRSHTAADKTTLSPPSRFSLRMYAGLWRSLQYVGMTLHLMAAPRPPSPSFTRSIPTTLYKTKGSIDLLFYTPDDYDDADSKKNGTTYPIVVNFHGGGFVLGAASDDARFGRHVVETTGAIFVSVDYRLAPEHPFPAAVEDGADALLYLIRNTTELRIDPMKIATSGFSAGGNICLASLLRLENYKREEKKKGSAPLPDHKIVAAAAWYPILDYNRTRAERRATCKRPDQALPSNLTDLFDASYLYPVDLDLLDPYLSPFHASDDQIRCDLPPNLIIYTCEWDMLQEEGHDFVNRLIGAPFHKTVKFHMIKGVPHGWDKSPNPLKAAEQSEQLYEECCQELKLFMYPI